MKLKDVRELIYCPCKLIIDNVTISNFNTHEASEFDDYEVIGIRARDIIKNGFCAGTYIELLCRE